MIEDTTIITKSSTQQVTTAPSAEHGPDGESSINGISIRAWIAIILVLEVCFMASFGKTVDEPLYSLTVMAVGFYFGQVKPKTL